MFSWPLTGVEGRAAAFAIAAEMMPWSGDCAEAASVLLLDQQASTNVTTFYLYSKTATGSIISPIVWPTTLQGV